MNELPAATETPTLPAVIYNGAGVVAEQPVIQEAAPKTVTVPPSGRRRLVESLVLFLCAILFLRTVAVEPFNVPTGSMAPSLCGNHKGVACPRCGYPVRFDEHWANKVGRPAAHCPNCGADNLPFPASEISGDRLLVDKNIYRVRGPRRWEVAVFICPVDKSIPYVKRVVGRPGEKIQIKNGDVWINGELARKTLAQARECRVPVFDADYAPPGGWRRRWSPDGLQPVTGAAEPPALPAWLTLDGNDLVVHSEDVESPRLAAYWHNSPDTGVAEIIRDALEYNGHTTSRENKEVHDFFLEFEAELLSGAGHLVVKVKDGDKLKGGDEATAQVAVGGEFGESKLLVPPRGLVQTANRPPLKPGKTYRVEMAFVDRRVSVAIDGHEYFSHDLSPAGERDGVADPFRIGAVGATIRFRHMRLYRDTYYRVEEGQTGAQPFQLGPDEYFLMGDNSANSWDSRFWTIPGVPERNFLGKPFLLHQPSRGTHWDLPGLKGDFQAIDWDRIRWLR